MIEFAQYVKLGQWKNTCETVKQCQYICEEFLATAWTFFSKTVSSYKDQGLWDMQK